MKIRTSLIPLAVASVTALAANQASAVNYAGNGNSGFGGAIGLGSLTLSDDGTTINGTFTKGSGNFSDVLVLYIDSGVGGFSSTAGFSDNGDGLRTAISGYNGSDRSLMTFVSGFLPDYAIALGPSSDSFGGLWKLADGGANSLNYVDTVNLSPTGTSSSGTYTFSLSLASIGVTAGNSFALFGTYVSNSGYRSTEAIAGDDSGTEGWNPFSQTSFGTYTTTPIPEPSTLAFLGLGGLAFLAIRRRK
jgi:hypothetical protein